MSLSGRQVVVTGADGFIGSHLVEGLVKEGAKVRALALYNSFGSWGWLDTLPKSVIEQVEVVPGDIRDANFIENLMKGCETCFHLAALIAIPYSYHAPDSYIQTNITGTLNILNAARRLGTSHLLVTSTSEVYGTAQYVPIDEKHPRQPQSPYSASKIGADCIAESFYRSFNTPVTIVRPFNTYGPRQSARAVIPTIITQILNGKKDIKLGSLHPTRDLVFVKDTVEGFIRIAKNAKTVIGEDINIATGQEISVGDLVQTIAQICEANIAVSSDDVRIRPKDSEVERLLGSSVKLESLIKWKPSTSLKDGLRETIKWFGDTENLRKYKADIYNI